MVFSKTFIFCDAPCLICIGIYDVARNCIMFTKLCDPWNFLWLYKLRKVIWVVCHFSEFDNVKSISISRSFNTINTIVNEVHFNRWTKFPTNFGKSLWLNNINRHQILTPSSTNKVINIVWYHALKHNNIIIKIYMEGNNKIIQDIDLLLPCAKPVTERIRDGSADIAVLKIM